MAEKGCLTLCEKPVTPVKENELKGEESTVSRGKTPYRSLLKQGTA